MGLSADLESPLLNECVPRGVLGQDFIGYLDAFSVSPPHVSTSPLSIKKNTGKIVLLHWVKAVGGRFSVSSYTALVEQPSIKSSSEEIISPLRSVTF